MIVFLALKSGLRPLIAVSCYNLVLLQSSQGVGGHPEQWVAFSPLPTMWRNPDMNFPQLGLSSFKRLCDFANWSYSTKYYAKRSTIHNDYACAQSYSLRAFKKNMIWKCRQMKADKA